MTIGLLLFDHQLMSRREQLRERRDPSPFHLWTRTLMVVAAPLAPSAPTVNGLNDVPKDGLFRDFRCLCHGVTLPELLNIESRTLKC